MRRIAARETPRFRPGPGSTATTRWRRPRRSTRTASPAGRSGRCTALPVGIKDIIDTRDMPTENGTRIDAGRRPAADAWLVARLRAAGAVILGKTVTTELRLSRTRPRPATRTTRATRPAARRRARRPRSPAGMVPLAVGTQTGGSVIRPASFCGVVGFKPTFGLIPRTGVLPTAAISTPSASSPARSRMRPCSPTACRPRPRRSRQLARRPFQLAEAAAAVPPLPPMFAFVRTPVWDKAEPETQEAFAELADALGDQCEEVVLPPAFAESHDLLATLMTAGFAHRLGGYYDRGKEQLSHQMRSAIEAGRQVSAHEFLSAVDRIDLMNVALEQIFSRYDAILTPSAAGVAPRDLDSTGDPAFCTIWQLAGTPAISLPLLHGESGLPIGVQLVGRRGDDHRLIRTAAWLSTFVTAAAAER